MTLFGLGEKEKNETKEQFTHFACILQICIATE